MPTPDRLHDFFAPYAGFTFNPSNAPEQEFRRLQRLKSWAKASVSYKTHRTAYLHALLSTSTNALDAYFKPFIFPANSNSAAFIEYDFAASPRVNFAELANLHGWASGTARYVREQENLDAAFHQQFPGRVHTFFWNYRGFKYDPMKPHKKQLTLLKKTLSKSQAVDAHKAFHDAFEAEFNAVFGEGDEPDWAKWVGRLWTPLRRQHLGD